MDVYERSMFSTNMKMEMCSQRKIFQNIKGDQSTRTLGSLILFFSL